MKKENQNVRRMHISTFHSFGVDILKNYGYLINVNKNFTILEYKPDYINNIQNIIQKQQMKIPTK